MLDVSEAELIRSLLGDSELSDTRVQQIMLKARGVEQEDFKLANSIVPEAGRYLPHHAITALVRADISDDKATEELLRQRMFFSRLSDYLPSLLRYFKFDPKDCVFNAVSCIDDCHGDFHIAIASQRRDKKERQILESFGSAIGAMEKALAALKSIHWSFESEFEDLHAIYSRKIRNDNNSNYGVGLLTDDLKVCIGALNIARARARSEEDYLLVSGNQGRSIVVEYAYTMSRFWNGPPLTTTPGSDFSAVCGLLFEIVSGIEGESLAGAINRYSRSKKRRKIDQEDALDRVKEGFIETDNFHGVKETCRALLREIEAHRKISNSSELDETAQLLLKLKINAETDKILASMDEYGPHLVWASQIPPDQLRESISNAEVSWRRLKDLEIELGKIRRRGRADKST